MSSRAAEWRVRLGMILISSGLALLVLEVAARILLAPAVNRGVAGTPISETSKTLGWRTRPGGSQRIVREDFDVKADAGAGEGDGGLDDLFGGGAGGKAEDALDIPLAKEIQKAENAERARKIIVEVIESQKQIKKDSKDAGYLLDCCSKAQAALIAAVGKGLRPESRREGVGKQLDQIEMLTSKIRDWLDGPHAAD